MTLLADDFLIPNGLAFSPDESVLYINDTRRGHIRAFNLLPNGTLAKQSDRVFADLRGPESGVPDGMKVDAAGNVYCGGAGGIYILDPQGKKLGRIVHGAARHHQYGVRGRRLENALLHHPHPARHGEGERFRAFRCRWARNHSSRRRRPVASATRKTETPGDQAQVRK